VKRRTFFNLLPVLSLVLAIALADGLILQAVDSDACTHAAPLETDLSATSFRIDICAYIDGRSLLIIRANTVQWHHLDWAAPGRFEFVNLPTIINGIEWYPEWPDVPNKENRWCNCFSSTYADLDPALPKAEAEVELRAIQARHSINIAERPSAANDYALIIDFDDDPVGGATWYECELTVNIPADLSISKSDSPDPATAGNNLTYTLTVTNNGPLDAPGVTVTDPLPAAVTLVSTNTTQGNCSETGGTLTCDLGDLANEAIATVTIVVSPTIPGTLHNSASVASENTDPDDANNSATESTTVSPPPPVGGEAYPVNKLAILAPWIAIAMAVIGGAAIFMRRRRTQE